MLAKALACAATAAVTWGVWRDVCGQRGPEPDGVADQRHNTAFSDGEWAKTKPVLPTTRQASLKRDQSPRTARRSRTAPGRVISDLGWSEDLVIYERPLEGSHTVEN